MKTTMITAVGMATAAVSIAWAPTIALPATAHADQISFRFLSPSGNIGCQMFDQDGNGNAVCKIRDHTWVARPSEYCQRGTVPGASGEPGSDLMLSQGNPPCVSAAMVQVFFSGPDAFAPLAYGQTHTIDAITCDSEPSGVTCTDTGTGHFFRVSDESYQLG